MSASPVKVVLMGVSGAGKTVIGRELATLIGAVFLDADDLHSPDARAQMASGKHLTDSDRLPWLRRVAHAVNDFDGPVVVACSALRRRYRDALRAQAASDLLFVHLRGSRSIIATRLDSRRDHFMPPELLDSQVATLEELEDDEAGFSATNSGTPAETVSRILDELRSGCSTS